MLKNLCRACRGNHFCASACDERLAESLNNESNHLQMWPLSNQVYCGIVNMLQLAMYLLVFYVLFTQFVLFINHLRVLGFVKESHDTLYPTEPELMVLSCSLSTWSSGV